ncbi:hypothetical protein [Streptomyces sp. NPDC051132]|uniref:hypothetical protein n=1 Tax=unclassified Streptomyces TaxID=2593676 RepID=UPI003439742C
MLHWEVVPVRMLTVPVTAAMVSVGLVSRSRSVVPHGRFGALSAVAWAGRAAVAASRCWSAGTAAFAGTATAVTTAPAATDAATSREIFNVAPV